MSKRNIKNSLIVVDVMPVAISYYFNNRLPEFSWTLPDGTTVKTKAMYGIFNILKQYSINDNVIVFCRDSKSFKKQLNSEYKANRSKKPDDLYHQVDMALEVLGKAGFPVIVRDGLEADDIIASVVCNNKHKFDTILVITNDFDLFQLIDSNGVVNIRLIGRDNTVINCSNFESYVGIVYDCYIPFNALGIYKAIVGDSSDNISGIKGLGKRFFESFINSIEDKELFVDLFYDDNKALKVFEYFGELKDIAYDNYKVVKPYVSELVGEIDVNEIVINKSALIEGLSLYGMKSIIKAVC